MARIVWHDRGIEEAIAGPGTRDAGRTIHRPVGPADRLEAIDPRLLFDPGDPQQDPKAVAPGFAGHNRAAGTDGIIAVGIFALPTTVRWVPGLSKGRALCRLTVPAIPPSSVEAVGDFSTSRRVNSSEGNRSRSTDRAEP